MNNQTAPIKLKTQPFKKDKAWQITPATTTPFWVPFSVVNAYNPVTMIIRIETWWLNKNNIKYTL
jgi:hypothetical protein